MTRQQAEDVGGRFWESPDGAKQRMYFPASFLEQVLGLSYATYKTGNISGASLRGQKLSNSKADALRTALQYGKCWLDLETQILQTQGLGNHAEAIIAEIRRRAAGA